MTTTSNYGFYLPADGEDGYGDEKRADWKTLDSNLNNVTVLDDGTVINTNPTEIDFGTNLSTTESGSSITVDSTDTTRTNTEIRNAVTGDVNAADLISGAATADYVLTADGSGGITWASVGSTTSASVRPTSVITANYNAGKAEIVVADTATAASSITVVLPAPDTSNMELTVKKLGPDVNDGGYKVVLTTPNTETIDGQTSHTLVKEHQSVTVTDDGSNYYLF